MKDKQQSLQTELSGNIATRERLMQASTELFTRKGYAATSVREIVAAAGVSKPVLYYYFKNKEGIFQEIVRFGIEKVDNLILEVAAMNGSVLPKIRYLFERTIWMMQEDLPVMRLLYAAQNGGGRELPPVNLQDISERFDDAVLVLVKEGIRRGEFIEDDPEIMRWVLVGTISLTMEMMLFRPELGSGRDSLIRMVDLILRGFAASTSR